MAIPTINRSKLQIQRDIKKNLANNVGITATNSTSTAGNLSDLFSSESSNTWDKMNEMIGNNFLSQAKGDALDNFFGELLQESRDAAKRAMDLSTSNFKIYLDKTYASNIADLITTYYTDSDIDVLYNEGYIDSNTSPTQINLPKSISVYAGNSRASYHTVNPITLSNTQDTDYSPIIANSTGDVYNVSSNSLVRHNIASLHPILRKITDAIKCTNLYGISNGSSIESDENYRYRLSNKVVASVSGNDTAVRKAALSVPGVVDVAISKRSHGNGTFTLFPRTVDPLISDGIIHAVEEAVGSVKSIGDIAFVEAPKYLGVTIKVSLRFSSKVQDKNTVFASVRLTVMDYINNLEEGGEIIINELIQQIMSINDNILDMNIMEFGYGDYDRTDGIVTGYVPLRLMNQKANWDERWYTNSQLCSICEEGAS